MESNLKIRIIAGANSERFPMLVNGVTGMPLFHPNLYITSIVRGKGDQMATMEAHLRAIKFLYNWGEKHTIDIDARFKEGDFLRMHEVESLAADVRIRADKLLKDISTEKQPAKVRNLESYKKALKSKSGETVSGGTAGVRFRYMRDYLEWLAFQKLRRIARSSSKYLTFTCACDEMKKAFDARVPTEDHHQNDLFRKLGLTLADQERLLAVVDPNSPDNPWKDPRIRYRNQLFVHMLLFLGIRKGEALGIRVADVNLQRNEVTIHRTPNDPFDSRLHQPQSKTKARLLPLNESLVRLCERYIIQYRSKDLPGARRQHYLFTETKKGNPLSIAAVDDIFRNILAKNPGIQKDLSAHILRHTWNDRFSELSDEKIKNGEWTVEDERKARCEWMGWVLDSEMAWHYSRRHIIEKAHEVGLRLQESILGKKGE